MYINADGAKRRPSPRAPSPNSEMPPTALAAPDGDVNAEAGRIRTIASLKDEINRLKGDVPARLS
jgi:hypothetical protein